MSLLNTHEPEPTDEIAIIGMTGRFPGAKSIQELWRNLRAGRESISFFTDEELLAEGLEPAVLRDPNCIKARAMIENIDLFDAAFFGFTRREAEITDPQQRLFLECAWEAFEAAGYDPETFRGRIGVYAGVAMSNYLIKLYARPELIRAIGGYRVMIGNDKDYLTTQTSYKLNLKGPSIAVQTACSTSLVAVHLACQSLINGECDMALAGGVSISVPQKSVYIYREGGINSPDGHCRAFDTRAQGTVGGSGLGVVVLRRLDDALADGDYIHAVIKGSAVNNDGAQKVGYTAPSVSGQAAVIADALAVAGVAASTISYVEAHGTGTVLGDPIEVSALTQAFRANTEQKGFCGLGSLKTNIGHLDAAAGVAGLIKTALALKHRQLPPSLNFELPNPKLELANSPFYVCTELKEWEAGDTPRRAGVSSFGIGGTNAHVILEEAPEAQTSSSARSHHLLILSAKTGPALENCAANLAAHLQQDATVDLGDVAHTLQVGRAAFKHRLMLTACDREDALASLAAPDAQGVLRSETSASYRPVIFMFPGQGAQHVRMAQELYRHEPVFREQVDHCARLLQPHLGLDLLEVLYPSDEAAGDSSARLMQTGLTQPALFVIEYALARLWMTWGVRPEAMIGHSVGEYVAACLADVFSLEDALMLIAARGALMQAVEPGAMLAVALAPPEVQPLLGDKLALAAINAPRLCVVSGPTEAVEELRRELERRDVWCQRLQTSHAFHSAMMDAILQPFAARFKNLRLQAPRIPYVSNLTGNWITPTEATSPQYWTRHLRETVRFAAGLELLLQEPQAILLEVGPGQALGALARQQLSHPATQQVVSSLPRQRDQHSSAAFLLKALGQLWLAGARIDWSALYAGEQRCRIPLPTYPFERQRYWVDPPASQAQQPSLDEEQESMRLAPTPLREEALEHMPLTQMEELMFEAQATVPMIPTRRDTVLSMLCTIVVELTGATPDEIDTHATFFELGVDSLLLIQSSQAIQDRFGVKIPFGQLFEELSTIDVLATHLDQVLPPHQFQPEPPAPQPLPVAVVATTAIAAPPETSAVPPLVAAPGTAQTVVTLPQPQPTPLVAFQIAPAPVTFAPLAAPTSSHSAVAQFGAAGVTPTEPNGYDRPNGRPSAAVLSGALESLMIEQLRMVSQLTSRQLELLHGSQIPVPGPHTPGGNGTAAPAPQETRVPAAQLTQPDGAQTTPKVATVAVATIEPAVGKSHNPDPYVPYKPIEVSATGGLTPRQQQHLDALIERYTRRTQGSKRLTQSSRPYLADSRVSVGFRRLWKEMAYPLMAARALGSKIWDVDGNEYVDVTMGFGVHLFGHSPPFITQAIEEQLKMGYPLGPQLDLTGQVARQLCELANVDRVNFCNSGTEAVMGAMRVARTVTRRNKIAVFTGAYHGWADANLIRAVPTPDGKLRGVPSAPGVSAKAIEDMMVLEYDNQDSLDTINAHAGELAAVLVEPVQSRRPELQPRAFLQELRRLTEKTGTLLIFDEMITGFRSHPGGAQGWFGVQADLATYGKVIGGGLPIGVVGGKAIYMDTFDGGMWGYGDNSAPTAEKTLFAGAFFKHPLTMAAAHAVLQHLKESGPQLQERLNERTAQMVASLNQYFERNGYPIHLVFFASLFRFVFPRELKYTELFFYHLGQKGIFTWEGGNLYLSTAHTDDDIERIIQAVIESVQELRAGGFLPEPSVERSGSGPKAKAMGEQTSTSPSPAASFAPSAMVSAAPTGNGHRTHAALPGAVPPVPVAPPLCVAVEASLAQVTAMVRPDSVRRRDPLTRMQFSLYFFGNYDAQFSEDKYRLLYETAKYADQNGFTAIWLPERHFNSFGGFSPNPAVLAATLARETERIQIRAGSVVMPLHHPIRVAEEWALVDNFSKGRVGISFASGWHPNDFAFAPDGYGIRHQLMDDGIETVRRLWRGESVPVRDGSGSDINVRLVPMPMQAELPVWLTVAHRDTAIKAGEIGASFLTNFMDHALEEVQDKATAYRAARARSGYDPETGHVTIQLHTFLGSDFERTMTKVRQPFNDYMRASFKLLGNKIKSQGRKIDFDRISETDLTYILSSACEQYMAKGALIGTPATCSTTIDSLLAAGVNEVSCLIDFGLDLDTTLESLHYINELRQLYTRADLSEAANAHDQKPTAVITLQSVPAPIEVHTAPLTEMQKQLWILSQMSAEVSSAYNESNTLRLRGELNVPALRTALQKVVNRHEALRTTFSASGDYQEFHSALEITLPLIDFSTIDPGGREAALEAWLAREMRAPFDLAQDLLLRARLVRLAEQDHLLLLTNHHIIVDGDSVSVVTAELSALYEAECKGLPCELPAPVRFSDYAQHQAVARQSAELTEADSDWLKQWTDSFRILELPTDRPRPLAPTFSRALCTMSIDPILFERLRSFTAQHRLTMFLTLLAGFKLLLHQLTGQEDIIVGINTADRLYARRRDFVGYRVYPVMVRTKIIGDPSFAEFFAAVRKQMLDAYEHQSVPLNKVFKAARTPGRLLPVTVGMNLSNEGGHPEFYGLEVEAGAYPTTAPALDVYLDIAEKSDGLLFRCNYNPDLFDHDTVRLWMDHLRTLLELVADNPARSLSAMPALPTHHAAERVAQTAVPDTTPRMTHAEPASDIYTQANLTKYQLLIWLGQKLKPNVPMYINAYCFTVNSRIEHEHLQKAFQVVIDQSDALRTVIQEIDDVPHQKVIAELAYELPLHDFSAVPEALKEAQTWVQKRCQMPLDINQRVFDAALIKLSDSEYLWYLNVHHLVADAWASALIARLVSEYYGRSLEGTLDAKVELPLFQAYVDHERQYLSSPQSAEAAAYWREKLAEPLDAIAFYGKTPVKQTTRVQRVSCELGPERSQKLKELAQREDILVKSLDATLTNIFGALLYTYLHRISGVHRLSLGIPSHNRRTAAFRETIGLFIQILPHRVTIEAGDTFLSIIEKLVAETFANRRYAQYPVGNSLEHQAYDVEYNFINASFPSFCGAAAKFQWLHPGHAGESLGLQVHDFERSGSFIVDLDFHLDVFSAAQREVAVSHFLQVVDAFLADPAQTIQGVKLLTPGEEQRVLEELNQTETPYPAQPFARLFESQVERTPDRVAIVCEGQELTYAQLNAKANGLAHQLQQMGVGPDVVVGLLAHRNTDLLIAMLAVFKAGGAYLPFDPLYPAQRLQQLVAQAKCALFLAASEFAATLTQVLAALPAERRVPVRELDELLARPSAAENPDADCAPDNLSYLIHTSGTTGIPKAAMIVHAGMVNHLYAKISDLQLTEDDSIVELASPCFDISVWQFLAVLAVGGRVHIGNDEVARDATLLLDLVERERISVVETVPSMLQAIIDELATPRPARRNLSALRWMVVTGEALSPELCRKWLAIHPEIPLLNAYGPTECSDDVTHYAVTQPPAPDATHMPIGRPVANTRAYVLDQNLSPLPIGVPGELFLGGAGVGRGYGDDPARTAAVFIPNPFGRQAGSRLYRTGDLVRYLPDGNLEFLGRLDNQVKIRGHRIELGEIEAVLAQHPSVGGAIVLCREDAPAEKRLVAYVVAAPGEQPAAGDLRNFLKERLPAYMLPVAFVPVEQFPLTPAGKLDRRALPAPEQPRGELQSNYLAPGNQTEQVLADIWAHLLNLKLVSVHDNFFELGGDSILSIQVAARANQSGLRISPLQIFQHQTIAELATVAGTAPAIASEQGVVTGPVPLTPIQRWFVEQNAAEPHHWNQAIMLELRQAVDSSALEKAIQQLLVHHDALRLRFISQGSGWQQFNAGVEETTAFMCRDLSQLPDEEQSAAIEADAAKLQTALNLEAGPLVRVALFEMGADKPSRLLLIIHHLVVDGVSWRILLDDLMTAYEQLSRGEAPQLPPKTTSFKRWAEQLTGYAQTSQLQPELNYWLTTLPAEAVYLPVDEPDGENTMNSTGGVTGLLTAEETQALLKEVPELTGARINDLLLTALAKTFAGWTGERTLHLDLEGHGREEIFADVDLSRTVGWFTTIFPVRLDLGETEEPLAELTAIKDGLSRIPGNGIGFGLLRYLSSDEVLSASLAALPPAQVGFNYLGQFDQVLSESSIFGEAKESTGPTSSTQGKRLHLLDINAFVGGGQLRVEWTYSRNVHDRATIESLAEGFTYALQTIIRAAPAGGARYGYGAASAAEAWATGPAELDQLNWNQGELEDINAIINKLRSEV